MTALGDESVTFCGGKGATTLDESRSMSDDTFGSSIDFLSFLRRTRLFDL